MSISLITLKVGSWEHLEPIPCDECDGNDAYAGDAEHLEICNCEKGVDEDGRLMITNG